MVNHRCHDDRDRTGALGAGERGSAAARRPDLRGDRTRRRHRPGPARAEPGCGHLSGVADQDDDAIPDLRGAESGPPAARPVSPGFVRGGGTQAVELGLTPGEPVLVRDLILGVVTRSANDAAAVLAEGLGGGSEANFAVQMTRKARQLGMSRTQYRNASGLPDPEQLTTARDIARLALALFHDFPREYRSFSVREFPFQGELVHSHDHLLEWYDGADGIKTGYTVASGFNLATSAVRNGRRLVGVIMGGESARSRDGEMARLLDLGFTDIA